ncbi:amidohydrolase family protein [Pollutibacter soli]|uniref:amidohydrolase family protein n=1 Tax=Pollutibacter soli TaxID=3034157 RepID=UPI0030134BD1
MYRLLIITLIFLSCHIQAQESLVDSKGKTILIKNVNLIPMDKETVIAAQDVLVRDGKIAAIGKTGSLSGTNNAFVVDGSGKYLMPGLAEMHAHVPPEDNMPAIQETGMLFALKGITTIRGMLGHPTHLVYREKINSGEITGPRFITSGPSLSGGSVKTPEEASAMVRAEKQAGYDFLKLHPGLTPETFAALVKTAKEVNIPFAGHVSYKVGVWRAIDAGYATIDHMDWFIESLVPGIDTIPEASVGFFGLYVADRVDESGIPKLISGLKSKNIWVVPTECLPRRWSSTVSADQLNNSPEMMYMSQKTRENWVNAKKNMLQNPKYSAEISAKQIAIRQKLLREMYKNGVGILLGSDAPQVFDVPGFSAHQELEYYVDAGLTPYQALVTGTVNVGRYLNRNDIGTIKVGSAADLILLNSNPLKNIKATQDIKGVMLSGKWMSEKYISQELKKLVKS